MAGRRVTGANHVRVNGVHFLQIALHGPDLQEFAAKGCRNLPRMPKMQADRECFI